jgi:aspartate dehydrogenase
MKIGLIGFGSIGRFLARRLGKESRIIWIVEREGGLSEAKIKARTLAPGAKVLAAVPSDCGGADVVVECASQEAVKALVPCLRRSDVLIMSVGALRDAKLLSAVENAARRGGRKAIIPSGAIGGLDAIKSVRPALRSVLLESRKPPAGFGREDSCAVVLFEGNAKDACEKFPKNINVAATLSLAGVGFEKTRVRIISDPGAKGNEHTITAKGEFGEMKLHFSNLPMKENPKTSMLAALAALRALRERGGALVVA